MKINNDNSGLSALFSARANPWAHKYEQELWNDCSIGQFESVIEKHKDILLGVTAILGYQLKSRDLARMLSTYSDGEFSQLANRSHADIRSMRQELRAFLNSTTLSTNCYAYALNIRKGFAPGSKLTPGRLAEMEKNATVPLEGDITALFGGLARDGIQWFDGDPNCDRPPPGHYLTALLMDIDPATGLMKDFHFVRYDRDGGCSHKTGHGYVTNLDHTGRVIADPTTQEIMPDYKYKGCLLIPSVLPQHKFS